MGRRVQVSQNVRTDSRPGAAPDRRLGGAPEVPICASRTRCRPGFSGARYELGRGQEARRMGLRGSPPGLCGTTAGIVIGEVREHSCE